MHHILIEFVHKERLNEKHVAYMYGVWRTKGF